MNAPVIARLGKAGCRVSLFIEPEPKVLDAAYRFGTESGLVMAETLTKPVRADELRRRMAVCAGARIRNQFTREIAARRMGEIYREFVGG